MKKQLGPSWSYQHWPPHTLFALAVIVAASCISVCNAAPVHESTDLEQLNSGTCYYNYNHYNEGDRILTNEPCLNCTCHNQMLMCYLRVCPFTKPIGHDCVVEKREDQCCPIITCPDVPVELVDHKTDSKNEVGFAEKYGCYIESKFYPEGAQVPSNPNKPCELCYCIRNRTSCLMQECTLHVDGCQPIYNRGVCCPVRYDCEHDSDLIGGPYLEDSHTTVRPTEGFILTTSPSIKESSSCVYNDVTFGDGALIPDTKPCEHCYCMKGDIVCAVQECAIDIEHTDGKNCTYLPPPAGECCPQSYICQDDESIHNIVDEKHELESPNVDDAVTTTSLPAVQEEMNSVDATESSEDLHNKLHETISAEDVQLQEHIDDIPLTSTVKPIEADAAAATTDSSGANIKFAQENELNGIESTTLSEDGQSQPEEEHKPTAESSEQPLETGDSSQTPSDSLPTELPIKSEVEIDQQELVPTTDSSETIFLTPNEIVPIVIPGEGDCLYNNVTYANNTDVASVTKCDVQCVCLSSIIKCKKVECMVALGGNCRLSENQDPEACCPTYECDGEEPPKQHGIEDELLPTASPADLEHPSGTTIAGEMPVEKIPEEVQTEQSVTSAPAAEEPIEHEAGSGAGIDDALIPHLPDNSEQVEDHAQTEVPLIDIQHMPESQTEEGLIASHVDGDRKEEEDHTEANIIAIQPTHTPEDAHIIDLEHEQTPESQSGSTETVMLEQHPHEEVTPGQPEESDMEHSTPPLIHYPVGQDGEEHSVPAVDDTMKEHAIDTTETIEEQELEAEHGTEAQPDVAGPSDLDRKNILPEDHTTSPALESMSHVTSASPVDGDDMIEEHATEDKQPAQESMTEAPLVEKEADGSHLATEDDAQKPEIEPAEHEKEMTTDELMSAVLEILKGTDAPVEDEIVDQGISTEKTMEEAADGHIAPEEGLEHAPEHGLEQSTEQGLEQTPEHGLEQAPEHGLEQSTEQGLEQAPEHGLEQSTEQGLEQGPEHGLEQVPEHGLEQSTEQGLEQAPEHGLGQAPEHGLEQVPEHGLEQSTEQGLEQAPEHGLEQSTEQGLKQTPEQGLEQAPEHGLEQSTEQGLEQAPEHGLEQSTEQGLEQTPEHGLEQSTEQGLEQAPEHGLEQSTEQGLEQAPEHGLEQSTEQGLKQTPEQGLEQAPEHGLEQSTEQGLEQAPEHGLEQSTEQGLEQTPEHGLEQSTEHGLKQTPEQGSEQTPEQGSEQTPEQGSEQTPEHGLEQVPAETPEHGSGEAPELTIAEGTPKPATSEEQPLLPTQQPAEEPAPTVVSEQGLVQEPIHETIDHVAGETPSPEISEIVPTTEVAAADKNDSEQPLVPEDVHHPSEDKDQLFNMMVDNFEEKTTAQPEISEAGEESVPAVPATASSESTGDGHSAEQPIKHTELIGTIEHETKPEEAAVQEPEQPAQQPEIPSEHPVEDEHKETEQSADLTTVSSVLEGGVDKTEMEHHVEDKLPEEEMSTGAPVESTDKETATASALPEKEDEIHATEPQLQETATSVPIGTDERISVEDGPEEHVTIDGQSPIDEQAASGDHSPSEEQVPEEHAVADEKPTTAQPISEEQPAVDEKPEDHSVPAVESHTETQLGQGAEKETIPAEQQVPVEHLASGEQPASEDKPVPVAEEEKPISGEQPEESATQAGHAAEGELMPSEHIPEVHMPEDEHIAEAETPAPESQILEEHPVIPEEQTQVPDVLVTGEQTHGMGELPTAVPELHGQVGEEQLPEGHVPVEQMPEKHIPVEQMPEEHIPVEQMPEEHIPVEQMPEKHIPVEQMPEEHIPVEQMPEKHIPVEQMPEEHIPVVQMPEENIPVEQMPEVQIPVEQMPEEHTSTEQLPAEHTPEQQLTDGQMPQEQLPAEHVPEVESTATHLGEVPEVSTTVASLPDDSKNEIVPEEHIVETQTDAALLPETDGEHIPESHTEAGHLPESQTEAEQLPGSHSEPEHLPEGQLPGSHTEPEHLPEGQLPESHTEPEHLPEGQLPGSHTEPEHLPEGQLPGSHTEPEHLPEGQLPGSHTEPEHLPEGQLPESHSEPEHLPEGHLPESHVADTATEQALPAIETVTAAVSEEATQSSTIAVVTASEDNLKGDVSESTTVSSSVIEEVAKPEQTDLNVDVVDQTAGDAETGSADSTTLQPALGERVSTEKAEIEEVHTTATPVSSEVKDDKEHTETVQTSTVKADVDEHKTESSLPAEGSISTDDLSHSTEVYEHMNKTEDRVDETTASAHPHHTGEPGHPHPPHLPHYPHHSEHPTSEESTGLHPTASQPGSDHFGTTGGDNESDTDMGPLPGGHYSSFGDEDYNEEEDPSAFGPGTCRYGGKLFVSAQQIPRDDPCDFCFCFRSDIICLQQSCPPPISGCHEEPISGFCCPRYECPVLMGGVLNMTTTTTTTTTMPPLAHHRPSELIKRTGCYIGGQSYKVGDAIDSASGPCINCSCGGDGQMKCEPKVCTPEPMLRQMIAVVASRRRR